MCGIVGARDDWLRRQGLDPEVAMRAATAALAWRGPDGQRVVRAGDWWLGCARLAIGPARSTQPLVRRGGRFVAVMNGAITNARELWARLLPGVERRAALPNDAWLPLLAVERADPAALRAMRGHRAYAVVDVQTGRLVAGRDRYGEKPMHRLLERDGKQRATVAFASTRPALRCLGVTTAPPPRRIAEWFRFGWSPERDEHLAHGRRLSTFAGDAVAAQSSAGAAPWQPPPRTAAPDLRDEVIARVTGCLDTSAQVGLLLSGGVDSSCLAAAVSANHRQLPCYQFRAIGAPAHERDLARAVAAHCGLGFHAVDGGPEVLDELPRLTRLAGFPLGDPSVLAVHATARAAAAHGMRVLLSGEGADELFLGYRRYRALCGLPRLRWLQRFTPRWSMHYAARWLRAAAAPDPAVALLAVTPPAFADTVLAAPWRGRRCWRDDSTEQRLAAATDPVLAARERDLTGYLRCDLLPKVDTATMAAGIEARCPFLDADVAAFGRTRAALGKRDLRMAFASDLPSAVFRQPKRGFALPLDRWFRSNLPCLDLLAETRSRQRPHLRPGGLAAAVDRHRAGRSNLGHGLYLLLAYEVFLRGMEQDSPARRTNSGRGA